MHFPSYTLNTQHQHTEHFMALKKKIHSLTHKSKHFQSSAYIFPFQYVMMTCTLPDIPIMFSFILIATRKKINNFIYSLA